MATDIPVAKQGAHIYLSLEGNARLCCKSIDPESIKGESGVKTITDKLKSLYAKDEEQLAFQAYEDFESFSRPGDMNVVEYLNEWQRLYERIKAKKMELPDGVLAYRVLKSANLSNEKQTLVRATISKLTLEQMKKQIRAVFDSTGFGSLERYDDCQVKVEPTYTALESSEEVYTILRTKF